MTTRTGLPVPIVSIVDEGLGHSSYVVGLGDGTALVVDPARFPDRQRRAAAERGWRIAWTADTHSHADYISGSPELGRRRRRLPRVGGRPPRGRTPPRRRRRDRRPRRRRDAAGHRHAGPHARPPRLPPRSSTATPEALFSGGSLMVGALGRTDLLGDEHREELARAMFRALHARDPHAARRPAVYPTHGAGSFCSAPSGSRADDDHRHRAGHQPAAEHRRRRPLRRHACSTAWAASPPTSASCPRSTGAARASTPSSPPSPGSTSTRSVVTSTAVPCVVDARPIVEFAGRARARVAVGRAPERVRQLVRLARPHRSSRRVRPRRRHRPGRPGPPVPRRRPRRAARRARRRHRRLDGGRSARRVDPARHRRPHDRDGARHPPGRRVERRPHPRRDPRRARRPRRPPPSPPAR